MLKSPYNNLKICIRTLLSSRDPGVLLQEQRDTRILSTRGIRGCRQKIFCAFGRVGGKRRKNGSRHVDKRFEMIEV